MKRRLTFIAVLIMISLACSVTESISSPETAESQDQSSASQQEVTESDVILSDDFSSSNSGWEVGDYEIGSVGYSSGYYFVSANSNVPLWGAAFQDYQDIIIEVDVTQYSGPDDNGFGVVCRLQGDGTGYYFAISGDGYYSIALNTDDFYDLVAWDSSSAILQGTSTNHMVVSCVGDRLTLEVNGTYLVETTDSTFTQGDIGLMAGTFVEDTEVEVHFDNLLLRQP